MVVGKFYSSNTQESLRHQIKNKNHVGNRDSDNVWIWNVYGQRFSIHCVAKEKFSLRSSHKTPGENCVF